MMIDLEDAQTYFDSRINSMAWDNQKSLQQKALNNAHRIVNNLRFTGVKVGSDAFPRDGATTVPQPVQDAICEIAYSLLDGVDPELEMQAISLQKQSIASASTTFNREDDAERIMAGVPSATAWGLLLPYMHKHDVFIRDRA